ncbi:MAG TPA: hypothetical protein VNK43_02850 [Gemmatimonadales bacterium]|nr:hypothetical protein [Gemmatimonadales bacterium]
MRASLVAMLVGVLAATLGADPLAAQAVVTKEKPLDPARAAIRDTLVVFRDTLHAVAAAGERFNRDLRTTSDASVLARARAVRTACERSRRDIPVARRVVGGSSWTEPNRTRRQRELLQALGDLDKVLGRCIDQFGAMAEKAGEARGYGPGRTERLRADLLRFHEALKRYLGSLGIRLDPPGVHRSPLAG